MAGSATKPYPNPRAPQGRAAQRRAWAPSCGRRCPQMRAAAGDSCVARAAAPRAAEHTMLWRAPAWQYPHPMNNLMLPCMRRAPAMVSWRSSAREKKNLFTPCSHTHPKAHALLGYGSHKERSCCDATPSKLDTDTHALPSSNPSPLTLCGTSLAPHWGACGPAAESAPHRGSPAPDPHAPPLLLPPA